MFKDMKTCPHCGNAFERRARYSDDKWARTRFCSKWCGARGSNRKRNTIDKFHSLFVPEPNSGCWLWTGRVNHYGYGTLNWNGRQHEQAHRISYEIVKGAVPAGLGVLHHCDTRCCVNPDHLYAGTQADNAADAIKRGRTARGERQPRAKLSEEDVRAIRRDTGQPAEIARRFNVSPQQVRRVRGNISWRHVQ